MEFVPLITKMRECGTDLVESTMVIENGQAPAANFRLQALDIYRAQALGLRAQGSGFGV